MADVIQFERKGKSAGEKLSPALRDFIDSAVVPLLLREYLADEERANLVASANCCVADSAAMEKSDCEVPA